MISVCEWCGAPHELGDKHTCHEEKSVIITPAEKLRILTEYVVKKANKGRLFPGEVEAREAQDVLEAAGIDYEQLT